MYCHVCNKDKPESQIDLDFESRTYGICKACVKSIHAKRANAVAGPRHTETYRTCYICEQRKPIEVVDGKTGPNSGFTYRASKGNWYSACKACNRHVLSAKSRAKKKAKK